MGLVRNIVAIELSCRTATDADLVTIPGMPLWQVQFTRRTHRGEQHITTTYHATEAAARRMTANLLAEIAPGVTAAQAVTDRTPS